MQKAKEELIDKGICDKGFIWNPSNCECECDKNCDFSLSQEKKDKIKEYQKKKYQELVQYKKNN